MAEAFFWGAFAASSLLIGALIVMWRPVSHKTLGLIMGFGSGVLISAVAFELVAEAFETNEEWFPIALGLGVGALTFYGGDWYIARMGGEARKSPEQEDSGAALPLLLGIVLDGIPESIVLGLSLLAGEGVSAAMLAAVFMSNLPESMGATAGFQKSGRSRRWILGLWTLVIFVCGLASLAGYGLFDGASDRTVAFVLAFAGGAILTMLSTTMVPEAHKYGGREVGLLTTTGFAVAILIVALETA